MSLPRYRSVGTEPASFVRVYRSPMDRKFFIGNDSNGRYQRNILLYDCLVRECGLTSDNAWIVVDWCRDAKVGDSISFPGVSVTGMPYPSKCCAEVSNEGCC